MNFYDDVARRIQELERQIDQLKRPANWESWTPVVTQSGSVTVTVTYAKFIVDRRLVKVSLSLAVTGSGTGGNAIIVSGLPARIQIPTPHTAQRTIGAGHVLDNSVPAYYFGRVAPLGVDDMRFIIDGVANYVGITPNFALASGDQISIDAAWELTG